MQIPILPNDLAFVSTIDPCKSTDNAEQCLMIHARNLNMWRWKTLCRTDEPFAARIRQAEHATSNSSRQTTNHITDLQRCALSLTFQSHARV